MNEAFLRIKDRKEFTQLALDTFQRQARTIPVYAEYLEHLKIAPEKITTLQQIPFLPIGFFKTRVVAAFGRKAGLWFQSSGTGSMQRSIHHIHHPELYKASILQAFREFFGEPEDYLILGLLPNYLENPHASLLYMVDYLMQLSAHPLAGYFSQDFESLYDILSKPQDRKILLFGVSFALLDFTDYITEKGVVWPEANQINIIETGGMKGRKKEITKNQMYQHLSKAFPGSPVYSEYSMTELQSQAYTAGDLIFSTPPWMRVQLRHTDDPLSCAGAEIRQGAINIIDLANVSSCAFIATEDIGRIVCTESTQSIHPSFEVLGRLDYSEIRGCSQLVL